MISLQEGVVARGTGRALQKLNRPLGGKSGTTNDFKDAWFIGSSPNLVVGAVIFFDHPSYLGKDESGGRLAAPVVRDFLEPALAGTPAIPFPIPGGIKLMRVNAQTGRVSQSSTDTILEAFRSGTESIAQTESVQNYERLDPDQDPEASPAQEHPGAPTMQQQQPLQPPPQPVLDGLY
jgi:penicillin-binding protein 1A